MDKPIVTSELFQLNSVSGGLQQGSISFQTITAESDKFVCVRDVQQDGQTSLVVVDLEKRESMRNNIKTAESAIMNPAAKVLALRNGRNLQVFDVDASKKLLACAFTDDVTLWKWVNDRVIGLVTSSAVYHWSLDSPPDSQPQKVFDRLPEMDTSVNILSYKVDETLSWLALVGMARSADGQVVGKVMLYSVENGVGRMLEGNSVTFISTSTPSESRKCNIMCMASNSAAAGGKLLILELPTGAKKDITIQRKIVDIPFSSPIDFPVVMSVSPTHKLLTIVTSRCTCILVDVFSATVIYSQQIKQSVVFCGTRYSKTGGVVCVDNQGSVFQVSVNNDSIIQYIKNQMRNPELALRVASDAGLGGVDDLFKGQLEQYLQAGDVEQAVRVCLRAPNESLRTQAVLSRFNQLPQAPGRPPAISTYFKIILAESPALNAVETVEMARTVIPRGGEAYIKDQYNANKLTASENLGDIVLQFDQDLAMRIFHKVEAHPKVVNILLQKNDTASAVEYCKKVNFNPDWRVILNNFVRVNPQDAVRLATMLYRGMGSKPVIDAEEAVDMFMTAQRVQQATEFLLEVLAEKHDESTAKLQTKLLEINIKHSHPSVAEKIFARGICQHYDGMTLAPLCERAGLFQRAIECYITAQNQDPEIDNLPNIRRCLQQAQSLNPEWLIDFFGKLNPADSIQCLEDLLQNHRQNFKIIVQVATKYSDALDPEKLIKLFLDRNLYDILYYYLGAILPYTRNPEVHFRYIEAAAEVGQFQELERVTRESPCYDPERTKNYLKNKRLTDQWPLINVCDQHNLVGEMVRYLVDTENLPLVEQYVQRRNPSKCPEVVGTLIDCNVSEDFIKEILNAAGAMCPADELVAVVEEKGRLRLILPWLEARRNEKKTDPALYNALAKIYIDNGQSPDKFLQENEYYDPMTVGKYCENRDPNLAYLAYRKGHCSTELVALCKRDGMWKQLARYLVQEQNLELWAAVLKSDEQTKTHVVEAVQQVALPESQVSEEVSTTVRAFMSAEMTHELTSLLDQIVVHGRFRKNRYLENLLIMSAIKARKDKVLEYVNTLEDYDAKDIANIATTAGLHEAAYTVYEKHNMGKEAVEVLLRDLKDFPRGRSYAQKADQPAVWTVLAVYLLQNDEVHEAIDALIRAKNPDLVTEVSAAAERTNQFGDLIKYLTMARKESKSKDSKIDTALVLTYAKTGRLDELEEFLKTTHGVQIMAIADKCFADKLYDSARVLYTTASNYPKLATCLIKLDNLPGAVETAQMAKSIGTWREVNEACIEAKEMKLANMCAVPLVLQAEEMDGVVDRYEKQRGLWEELFSVLKTASATPGAHMGIFTQMGVLLAKYKPDKLLEHVNMYPKKLNTHKLIGVCETYHHWLVLRVLNTNNEDWLAAASIMMRHPVDAFDAEVFKDVISKLGASDVVYSAIPFYLNNYPEQLHDFLTHVFKKVDPERVLVEVTKIAPIYVVRRFLEAAQGRNSKKLNEALNNLYVEEEDFAALRHSVDTYNNFDSAELSARLEKMELFEFRKIALFLHRKNKRYTHAIKVAKENKLYQDAIDTAAESGDSEIVEDLLEFFVIDHPECFAACLYTCYEFIQPQVALEKAWLNGRTDIAMPYVIQVVQDYTSKVNRLERSMLDAQKAAKDAVRQAGPMQAGPEALMIQNYPSAGGMPPPGAPMQMYNYPR